MQYAGAALDDAAGRPPYGFYSATVVSRALLALGFTAIVCAGQCPIGLGLLAAINLLGAGVMYRAMGYTLGVRISS